jgi:tRNA pseudouridine55 synthase
MQADRRLRTGKHAGVTGVLVLNKPSGITSRKLVDQVARLALHSKVGHAGTLDPLATGILIVCIGTATRLVENLQELAKTYRTLVRLGARSDTLDADGQIEIEPSPRIPSLPELERALQPLTGDVDQRPPAYSALKIQGRRAYELARAGLALELAPRRVRIDRIEVLQYDWPNLELEIDCGGGTYIRSIARDVGETLGCGGFVQTLVRTRTGPFTLAAAIEPALLSSESICHYLRPAIDAVAGMARLVLDAGQVEAVAQGRRLYTQDLGAVPIAAGQVALLNPEGILIALGEFDPAQGWIQPRKVLL